MAACAHGADYEKCPPRAVAKEFFNADQKAGKSKAKRSTKKIR
jgi:hypothetical protein